MIYGSPVRRIKLKLEKFIDLNSNLVLKTSHPSPLSAYRGFIGSRPFSKSNKFLKSKGKKTIDWSL